MKLHKGMGKDTLEFELMHRMKFEMDVERVSVIKDGNCIVWVIDCGNYDKKDESVMGKSSEIVEKVLNKEFEDLDALDRPNVVSYDVPRKFGDFAGRSLVNVIFSLREDVND